MKINTGDSSRHLTCPASFGPSPGKLNLSKKGGNFLVGSGSSGSTPFFNVKKKINVPYLYLMESKQLINNLVFHCFRVIMSLDFEDLQKVMEIKLVS